MDYPDFDMFGDPVSKNFNAKGRPEHTVTDESRKKVMLLWSFGKSNEQVAQALGISLPTFNKHYFKNKKLKAVRDAAAERLELKTLWALLEGVEAGNASMINKMLDRIDRQHRVNAAKAAQTTQPKKGKKELAKEAAHSMSSMYAPPSGHLPN